jgi:DNA-binding transcriptional MerR regulator
MRGAGLSIKVLKKYVSLFQQGDSTIEARKEVLMEQRRCLAERINEMRKTLDRLDYKIEMYEKVLMAEKELIRSK